MYMDSHCTWRMHTYMNILFTKHNEQINNASFIFTLLFLLFLFHVMLSQPQEGNETLTGK
jgi:hypothetical protein